MTLKDVSFGLTVLVATVSTVLAGLHGTSIADKDEAWFHIALVAALAALNAAIKAIDALNSNGGK